jgi:hypothetical protein
MPRCAASHSSHDGHSISKIAGGVDADVSSGGLGYPSDSGDWPPYGFGREPVGYARAQDPLVAQSRMREVGSFQEAKISRW